MAKKTKVKKEDISPQEKLRRTILEAQKRYEPKPKPKPKPKPVLKGYTSKSSFFKGAAKKLKRIFSKKKKKRFTTRRTKKAERNLSRSISKKQIAKLRDKKK